LGATTMLRLLAVASLGVTSTALHDALGLRKQEPDHAAGSDAREAYPALGYFQRTTGISGGGVEIGAVTSINGLQSSHFVSK